MTTVVSNTLKCACAAMFVVCHAGVVHAQATRSYSPGFCTPVFNGSAYGNPTYAVVPGAGFANYSGGNLYVTCPIVNDQYLNYPLFGVSIYVYNPNAPVGSLATSVSCSLYGLQEWGHVSSQSNGTSSRSGSAEIYLARPQGEKGIYNIMCLLPPNGKILYYLVYY